MQYIKLLLPSTAPFMSFALYRYQREQAKMKLGDANKFAEKRLQDNEMLS
jgi:hypothetical protein